jgi:signal transduction histidine kinase
MITVAVLVALGTLGAGIVAGLLARRLPSVRLQLTGLALGAMLLPLAAVLVPGVLMFESGHDLTLLAIASGSSFAALIGAALIARAVVDPLDRLRGAATRVAGGELSARAPSDGPREIAEVATAFNHMAGHLEELFDARRQLVAWASHDLRTPLASLQAMLEAVEDGLADAHAYLPAMQDQVRALSTLVDDLFELARLDAGAITLEMRAAPVDDLVASCLRGAAAEALARHVRLEARIPGDVPVVICAPDKVERVLSNLVRNALRHTPSDGSVAVVVRPEGDQVQVAVEDTGEGLPADTARRMFDRFWRGDRARRSDGGAGLGLAIARGLVEAHGGRIWAEDRPEGGARVCFTLPLAPPPAAI